MADRKFAKQRGKEAGTVYVRFRTSDPAIVVLVRDYVKSWCQSNSVWRSQAPTEEPRIEDGPGAAAFALVMDGRPSALRWREAAGMLVDDIVGVFPEAKFERFEETGKAVEG